MPLIIIKRKNQVGKVRRIHKNGAQNLQVTHTELSIFWRRILTTILDSIRTTSEHTSTLYRHCADIHTCK